MSLYKNLFRADINSDGNFVYFHRGSYYYDFKCKNLMSVHEIDIEQFWCKAQQSLNVSDVNAKIIFEGDIVHREPCGIEWIVQYDEFFAGFSVFNGINSNREIRESFTEHTVDEYGVTVPIAEVEIYPGKGFLCEIIRNK